MEESTASSGTPPQLDYRHHASDDARIARAPAREPARDARDADARAASGEDARLRVWLERLQEVSIALGGAHTPAEVAEVVTEHAVSALGADGGAVGVLTADGQALEFLASRGYDAPVITRYRRIALTRGIPPTEVARTGEAMWIESPAAYAALLPDAATLAAAVDTQALVAVPLAAADRRLGAVVATFRRPRRFDDAERAFMMALARQGAITLERARLFMDSRQALAEVEDARRETERERERLARVFEQFPGAAAVLGGPRHVFRATSAAWRELVGRDVVGHSIHDAMPDLRGQGFFELLDHVYRTGIPASGQNVTARWDADGDGTPEERVIDFTFQPLLGGDGRAEGVVAIVADQTAQFRARAAQQLLARAGETLADALDVEATLEAVARLALPTFADYCIVDVLDVATGHARRVATAHADPKKQSTLAVVRHHPPDVTSQSVVARVLRSGRSEAVASVGDAESADLPAPVVEVMRELAPRSQACVPMQARGRTVGALLFARTRAGRAFDDDDVALAEELGRRAGLAVDGARLYQAERRARAAAEEANRTKAEFLATMSHELRTPLTAIMGYEALLEDEIAGPITEGQRAQLRRISASADHLLGLIDEVLSFARLEAGRLTMHPEAIDASAVAESALVVAQPLAAQKGLALDVSLPAGSLIVVADAPKLRQILINLLSNAVKFTERGSVALEVARAGDRACFTVTDTGVGIAPEQIERVFEPFVQVDQRMTRRVGGSGLGLSVARRLARLQGGDVTVESALGVGSRFTTWLPIHGADGADGS